MRGQADKLRGIAKFGALDCGADMDACARAGVAALPTVKVYGWQAQKNPYKPRDPPAKTPVDFNGERNAKALSDFSAGGGGSATVAELATAFDARDALVDLAETGVAGGAGPPDLLILASRGPAALKRAALGSVCAYVIAHAPASLCVVPPPALAA